jgi:hypothetical protein
MKEYNHLIYDVCGLLETEIHDIKFQKIVPFIFTAMRTSYVNRWKRFSLGIIDLSYTT